MKRMFPRTGPVALVIALLAGAVSCSDDASKPASRAAEGFASSPCAPPVPPGLVEGETVRCGTLTVPENRNVPDGKQITLSVMIVKGTPTPKPDPIVHLQGGPGGAYASYDSVVGGEFGLGTSRQTDREIVFFDQRGTGRSKPSLVCGGKENRETCLARWAADGIDLAAYNSEESARDVEDLRTALGYEKLNLYGQSYGTILAQTVMRLYPASVRSVVLESVSAVPFDAYLTSSAKALELALGRVFEECAADPSCAKAFPDPAKDLATVLDALAAKKADPSPFIEVLSILTQLAKGTSYVPLALRALASDDEATFKGVVKVVQDSAGFIETVQSTIALGANSAVDCFDYGPLWTPAREKEVNGSSPGAFQAVLAEDTSYCNALPPSRVSDTQRRPFASDIPTLQLSGSHDSNTPKDVADALAPSLLKGHRVVVPGWGHVLLAFVEPCSTSIFRQFIEDPSKPPITSCLAKTAFATTAP